MDTILSRLMKIFREFSTVRRVYPDSQLCCLWEDPTIEEVLGSVELNAILDEFGIVINNQEEAFELYTMTLQEAAARIEELIKSQDRYSYSSDSIVAGLSADKAKRILLEMWNDSFKARGYITTAIAVIEYEDNNV